MVLPMVQLRVAPHVGAWIEIPRFVSDNRYFMVAPHVGAWIEIKFVPNFYALFHVAPHVGAWIEIVLPEKISRQ